MKTEIKDISHGKKDEGKTFDHHCVLEVKTTDDNGSVTETKEQGYMIQGKDCIYLKAPKIYLPNLPTERQDITGAFEEVLGKLQDGEGGDWQPPDWWIPVPEPEPYDIYVLIWATKTGYQNPGMNFALYLRRESDNGMGYGNIFCDWGDGTTEEINPMGFPRHTYTEEGQYLVHIIADENTSCWGSSTYSQAAWQIIKTGKNIVFATDYQEQNGYPYANLFPNKNYLKHVQINHSKGLPKINYLFENCNAIQKIELAKKFSEDISQYAFRACYGLTDFGSILNSDEIASVSNSAFGNCYSLRKIYLPNCTYIGDSAFSGCYNLQEIVVAENCTFGTNCFQNCYSLYPRPDGSVN